tara:strand:- start:1870 stop:2721 length:852 start_codon:yes stop_codon:yes gene_type:complete
MIIWLASYPKSGNTWIRSFISTLLYSKEGENDFSHLKQIRQFPDKEYFKDYVKNSNDVYEIAKNWIVAQTYLNLDQKIKFFKTHHVNCTIDNNPFTNLNNTIGVIHIVRDPRNVINSIKNHWSLESIDESKKIIFNENNWLGIGINNDDIKSNDFPTLISSWKTHYNSWKNKSKNYLLVKYENLIENPLKEFSKVAQYLSKLTKVNFSKEKIQASIESNSFTKLKKLESKGLFIENAFKRNLNKKINFFNLGPKNDWKKILDTNISSEIEIKFNKEMKELGYL